MTNQNEIKIIESPSSAEEINECFPAMKELRPNLSLESFIDRVSKQMNEVGYKLVFLRNNGEIKSLAGIRFSEWLFGGKFLEIDDLVSISDERSKGFGGELFDWIVDHARSKDCEHIRLVSHIRRKNAHRFYLSKSMLKEAFYFSLEV